MCLAFCVVNLLKKEAKIAISFEIVLGEMRAEFLVLYASHLSIASVGR